MLQTLFCFAAPTLISRVLQKKDSTGSLKVPSTQNASETQVGQILFSAQQLPESLGDLLDRELAYRTGLRHESDILFEVCLSRSDSIHVQILFLVIVTLPDFQL